MYLSKKTDSAFSFKDQDQIVSFDSVTFWSWQYRSTHPEFSCKKGVFKVFAKFTGKRQCWYPIVNKVAGWRSATLLKNRLGERCFPVNFANFLRKCILQSICKRLRLTVAIHKLFFINKIKKSNFFVMHQFVLINTK